MTTLKVCSTVQQENGNHDFIDEQCPLIHTQLHSSKSATVVIGTMKSGKSSLISLFCGTGHSPSIGSENAKACTMKPELYEDILKGGDKRWWLDTCGTDDYFGRTDEQLSVGIFRKLQSENISKIKVVWVISGDPIAGTPNISKQAKFIQSLSLTSNNDFANVDIWKSCLIIIKKHTTMIPSYNSIKGVILAARENGCIINNFKTFQITHVLAYTAIEWMINIHTEIPYLNLLSDQMRNTAGYLNNEEIRKEVCSRIDSFPFSSIHYQYQRCIKCSEAGDPRYILAPCHTTSIMHHRGKLCLTHSKPLEPYHCSEYGFLSKLELVAIGTGVLIVGATASTGFDVVSVGIIGTKCIGENGIDNQYNSCTIKVKKWKCCGNNDPHHSGCENQYKCCGYDPEQQNNNNSDQNNIGCTLVWDCCGEEEKKIGCTKVCKYCLEEWGTNPGCIILGGRNF